MTNDLDAQAMRAVDLATEEAGALGHSRVGTEHLLLGLIAAEGSASTRLAQAGASLAAARHKVAEAGGPPQPDAVSVDGERTDRATRALNRAVRFAHAARSDTVSTEHLLLGVLDVEGSAGQILRRLGVDVPRLRAALQAPESAAVDAVAPVVHGDPTETPEPRAPVVCPSCSGPLADAIALHELSVLGRKRPVGVLACAHCGAFLGVSETRPAR
jgi:ATP-dependent Clp protease ATP-binding subunit ClpA